MVLTTFGNRPKKLDSIHQTDFHQEVHTGWAWD